MSEDRNERLSRLGERFTERGTKPTDPPQEEPGTEDKKRRKRRTFYIDERLISRLDRAFPKFNYEINPKVMEKSEFLEMLLEYSLDNLEEVKSKAVE